MTAAKNTICIWYDKDAEAAAQRWPFANPSTMPRATVILNRWHGKSLSLKRPWRFLEKVASSGTASVRSSQRIQR